MRVLKGHSIKKTENRCARQSTKASVSPILSGCDPRMFVLSGKCPIIQNTGSGHVHFTDEKWNPGKSLYPSEADSVTNSHYFSVNTDSTVFIVSTGGGEVGGEYLSIKESRAQL